jgi:sterol desaturase/sphingolipid hydroxylase (fatty acid hydroxylase superfamily)
MQIDLSLVGFLKAFGGQALSYLFFTGILFLAVWKLGKAAFAARRIQKRERANAKQIRRELMYSASSLLLGTLSSMVVMWLYTQGKTKVHADGSSLGLAYNVASVIALVVFNDAWFFLCHRILHTKFMFKHVHTVHHQSIDVTPFSSYSFHPIEALMVSAWVIPVVTTVPLALPVLSAMQIFGLAKNLEAHLGYEFWPQWFNRVPLLRSMTNSTYHNQHHALFNGNYALYFRYLDRLFGSELQPGPARSQTPEGSSVNEPTA